MVSAWDSGLDASQACSNCTRYRARRDEKTCCDRCTENHCTDDNGTDESDGHAPDCARLTQELLQRIWESMISQRLHQMPASLQKGGDVLVGQLPQVTGPSYLLNRRSRWERFRCDLAAEEDAVCLVVPPREEEARRLPAPVILFLTGNGHIDDRQDFLWGGIDTLLRNPELRHCFFVAPKPLTKTGTLRRNDRSRWVWSEDGVWALFTEVLRRLGPDQVDPTRLYATGLSLGAAGVWHLALRYGNYLAAAVPISGQCEWPGESWPSRKDADPSMLRRLTELPLRVYHVDIDRYGGNPAEDMEWLCWQLPECKEEATLRGMEVDRKVELETRSWHREPPGASWHLCMAKGPLKDWAWYDDWGGDKHCLWQRVYPWPEWGLAEWLFQHSRSPDCCWRFDSEVLVVDSTEERKQEEAWLAAHREEAAKEEVDSTQDDRYQECAKRPKLEALPDEKI
eukprot:TRINITY_DN5096_c0_g1_i4.p1 TRINITY_DN5096_c0_g1~~TRINITY_DN5096_c0_g1_i4.p1  ORF type:complete len:454 (-),score=91.44 TRINITY_DN5096_c0_g1_i4:113-1474(-)